MACVATFRACSPLTPMTYTSSWRVLKLTCDPSGEMLAYETTTGGNVNWRRSEPSVRLRHSVWSGYERYATHAPSRDIVASFADAPSRNEASCPDRVS